LNKEEELRDFLRDVFSSQRLAVLATHSRGAPYCSLVGFAATDDLKFLLFATTRSTRKFANLNLDQRVSLLIDTRANRDEDFQKAAAITATGQATEVDEPEKDNILKVYLAKHPYMEGFVSSPTCALVKVKVDTYYVVRRFQEVTKLSME